jgi:hypothetical protein
LRKPSFKIGNKLIVKIACDESEVKEGGRGRVFARDETK